MKFSRSIQFGFSVYWSIHKTIRLNTVGQWLVFADHKLTGKSPEATFKTLREAKQYVNQSWAKVWA